MPTFAGRKVRAVAVRILHGLVILLLSFPQFTGAVGAGPAVAPMQQVDPTPTISATAASETPDTDTPVAPGTPTPTDTEIATESETRIPTETATTDKVKPTATASETATHTAQPTATDTAIPSPLPSATLQLGFAAPGLAFVPNVGQTDAGVRFQANGLGGALFFTPDEIVVAIPPESTLQTADESDRRHDVGRPSTVLRLRYAGANTSPVITGADPLPGMVNYFIGDDPDKWFTNITTYERLVYKDLYPGVDLVYTTVDGQLKSTYLVAPGADPQQIRWRYDGAVRTQSDQATGDLLIDLPQPNCADCRHTAPTLREMAPVAWQVIDSHQVPVPVAYAIDVDGTAAFVLPDGYDSAHTLVLDPILVFSTYHGGSTSDFAQSIAVGPDGSVYVAGFTQSTNFPTANPYDSSLGGTWDVFVSKFSSTGTTLLYSTYLGGSSNDRQSGGGLAVDSSGNAYVTGKTQSSNFPTLNPYDATLNGGFDVFVSKLSADGSSLLYSTYLGGTGDEDFPSLAINGSNIFVAGTTTSSNFPTVNAYDSTHNGSPDGFVTKFNASGSALDYSTFLGSSVYDHLYALAVDSSGHAYVTGYASSSGFPTTAGAYDTTHNNGLDVFVTKLNTAGNGLIYSTFIGGSASEHGNGIAVDASGQAYVTGYTLSDNFPKVGALQTTRVLTDAFVSKLNSTGSSLLYSTYLGGNGDDRGHAIVVDSIGQVVIVGQTTSTNLATQDAVQASLGGGLDAFVVRLNAAGSARLFSSYLGGSANEVGWAVTLRDDTSLYIAGETTSFNFPTAAPLQSTRAGNADGFVARIDQVPTVQFHSSAYAATESEGAATITITLSSPIGLTVTVAYTSSNGTALAGTDYTAATGTLTFLPDETVKTFTVAINDDTMYEQDETVNLVLGNPSVATLGTPAAAVLTITNDDAAPQVQFSSGIYTVTEDVGTALITVTLSAASGVTATVDFAASDDTAMAGSDYTSTSGTLTFEPGQTIQTFNVPILDDSDFEAAEALALTLSNPAWAALGTFDTAVLTILDDDEAPAIQFSSDQYVVAESELTATITVTLSAVTGLTVTVDYATSDGAAIAGSDYLTATGSLSFAPGVTEKTFDISIIDDANAESPETVNLILSNPVYATLGAPDEATLTIVDDDEDEVYVQFSSGTYSARESAGAAVLTATLSAVSSVTVTVGYATSNGTATAGSDYIASTGTLTFAPGSTLATLNVTLIADVQPEPNETFTVTLSSPVEAELGSPDTAVVTITHGDDLIVTTNTTMPAGVYTYSTMLITNNATLTTLGNTGSGTGVTIFAANVQVDAGARISADGRGYGSASGPGAGTNSQFSGPQAGGGGYGGSGGTGSGGAFAGGLAYGDVYEPTTLGSGGGSPGGAGGGALHLVVTGTLTIDGNLTANGGNGANGNFTGGGGGSGGSLWLVGWSRNTATNYLAAPGGYGSVGSHLVAGGQPCAAESRTDSC